jgi:hypothetical protein
MLEQGYHLFNHNSGGHAPDEFRKVVRRTSAHHGCVIADESGELLSEARLNLCAGTSIRVVVEAGGGDFGGKPVGAGEADGERDEVLFDLLGRELVADFVEGLHGLRGPLVGCMNEEDATLHTLSRTRGSSMVARFSKGERSTCPYSGPPTYSTKLPSSSDRAVRTSSSSSTDSVVC